LISASAEANSSPIKRSITEKLSNVNNRDDSNRKEKNMRVSYLSLVYRSK
jgi:hypothetical protein